MSRLQFHPVWDRTLTDEQKEEFAEIFKSLPPVRNDVEAILARGKHKKNGGAVATVFLRNNSTRPLEVKHVEVEICGKDKELIAAEEFSPGVMLEADSVQPWSFVFAKESVYKTSSDTTKWKVKILMSK